ncbi:hypothetical protein ANN_04026 [Periplaneta americana]|uniref:HTH CENPB-type domain-containing protein n=1 Tax=Periplaneta americana TaxID=6978 RepID=A0ABQ8T9T6_PERAM|nr:hypothetical protein ANN_04026 [Periplaneta americana]
MPRPCGTHALGKEAEDIQGEGGRTCSGERLERSGRELRGTGRHGKDWKKLRTLCKLCIVTKVIMTTRHKSYTMYDIQAISRISLKTAMALLNAKIVPIATYGIYLIWEKLSLKDLMTLEAVKSRFLKATLGISKYTKSRRAYELAREPFFIEDLRMKLPSTESSKKLLYQREKREKGHMVKANEFACLLGNPNFNCCSSWIQRFRPRYNIVARKICGEAAIVPDGVTEEWLSKKWPALCEDYKPDDVLNADETGLFCNMTPDKTVNLKVNSARVGKCLRQESQLWLLHI